MGMDAGGSHDPAAPLEVEETGRSSDAVELSVKGELDLVTAPLLRAEIDGAREGSPVVVLDLAGVRYIDSTGLVLLLEVTRDAPADGWALRLRRTLSPAVSRLLAVTKTESLFTWADPS